MHYLVVYDVSDNKVRGKVSNLLFKFGQRVQLSCFEVELSPKELKTLVEKISKLIDLDSDCVIFYPLTENSLKQEIVISGERP